jgi:tetratricopeptide (TPR) repeat protein
VDFNNSNCNFLSANINLQLREFETSVKYFRKFRKVNEERGFRQFDNLYREGFALIQMGNQQAGMELIEAQLLLLDKRKKLGRPDGHDYHYAAIYTALGDHDKALQHLRDYQEKTFFISWRIIPISYIQHDIMFENLWYNEEFQAIVRRDQQEKTAIRAQIREMEKRGELDL